MRVMEDQEVNAVHCGSGSCQQQNCWFKYHPCEQKPSLKSESHSVMTFMNAALAPIKIPAKVSTPIQNPSTQSSEREKHSSHTGRSGVPMRVITIYCCPASIVRATTLRSQLSFHRLRRSRSLTRLLYRSRAASCTQSPINTVLERGDLLW